MRAPKVHIASDSGFRGQVVALLIRGRLAITDWSLGLRSSYVFGVREVWELTG